METGKSIVKVKAAGQVISERRDLEETVLDYTVHLQYLVKHGELFYLEEELEKRQARFISEELHEDIEIHPFYEINDGGMLNTETGETGFFNLERVEDERVAYTYDRLKAVRYAERWWNDYNPAYKKFEVDCTNFVSQCLHAGGAPMWGSPNRSKGWWMARNTWSYSWAVANALRIYLSNSRTGLRAREVKTAGELNLGDVICYDFQGDGRFDHNTIVTAKDANGMPLVNAHTYNSRMRNWAYKDSTAYTPNIKYKFYTILDGD
ncbi:hypothetical protein D0469_02620 [Peribacillus saganii]|uniref:Putative amidase domain-containing protein n=2 Tax=Peribacillus saganii TaxID=2303992 RepID=A0A372LSS9_9BACI|nr:hypothetical protein D0469_02620 [Peribacillus saganii]